jgi:pescadillo protein
MDIAYPLKVDDDIDCAGAGAITLASSSNIITQVEESQKNNVQVEAMASKIAKLEEEIKAMDGPSKPRDEAAGDNNNTRNETSDDEGEDVMIDGAEEDSEEQKSSDESEEESGSSEDEEDPENNAVEPIRSKEEMKTQQQDPTSVDISLVGGASDVADEGEICSSLFRGLKFFLGREVPKEQLSLVIRSFGGTVGWDGEGSPFEETDAGITHHVIDRPKPLREHNDRVFVQPQWVFDSANAQVLVLCNKYAPGKVPPPHLSPFVKPGEDDYIPEYAKEIQALKDAAQRLRQQAAGKAVDDEFLGKSKHDLAVDKQANLEKIEEKHAEELAQELKAIGKAVSPPTPSSKKNKDQNANEKDDEDQMKDIMMTRKVKRAYQRAMQEKAAKRAKSARLEKRAASLRNK